MKIFIRGIGKLGCMLCVCFGLQSAQAQTPELVLGVNAAMASMTVEQ
jgi:hypothetical protein